jgi:hypothetical protein
MRGRSQAVGISAALMISYDLYQLPLIPACPDKNPRETQEYPKWNILGESGPPLRPV